MHVLQTLAWGISTCLVLVFEILRWKLLLDFNQKVIIKRLIVAKDISSGLHSILTTHIWVWFLRLRLVLIKETFLLELDAELLLFLLYELGGIDNHSFIDVLLGIILMVVFLRLLVPSITLTLILSNPLAL